MRNERRGGETHVYADRCVSPRVARCRRGGSHSQPCEPLGVSASPPRRIEAFEGRDSGAGGAMAARPSPRASAPAACGRRTHGFVGPRHRPRSAGSARGWPQRSRLPGDARALLTRTRELGWLGADSSGAWGARPWASRGAPPTRAQLAWAPPIIRASCSASGAALSTFQQHFYVRLRGRSGGALGSAAASTSGLRSSPRWLDGVPRPRGQQLAKRGGAASAGLKVAHIGRWRSCWVTFLPLRMHNVTKG